MFHYVPLHVSPVGKIHGRFHGEDRFTTSESNRLIRLPLYYGLEEKDQEFVVQKLNDFFKKIMLFFRLPLLIFDLLSKSFICKW